MAKEVKLTKLDGTTKQLASIIREAKVSDKFVFKKNKSRIYTYVWWEDRDKWFLNVADGDKTGPAEDSRWNTEPQLETMIDFHIGHCDLVLYKVVKK